MFFMFFICKLMFLTSMCSPEWTCTCFHCTALLCTYGGLLFLRCRDNDKCDSDEWKLDARTSSDVQRDERRSWRGHLPGWAASADISRDRSQSVRRRQPACHHLWARRCAWQLHCRQSTTDRLQTHLRTQQRLGDFHRHWGCQAMGQATCHCTGYSDVISSVNLVFLGNALCSLYIAFIYHEGRHTIRNRNTQKTYSKTQKKYTMNIQAKIQKI